MSKVLIIGAGGVGRVVAFKCAQNRDVFSEIMLASRTKKKCDRISADINARVGGKKIQTARIDADDVPQVVELLKKFQPKLVINVALPYQDLPLMDACLAAGIDYMDTANYEPKDEAKFEYSWQWAYQDRYKKAGLLALLGCGFDPGVTSVFTAYAAKHYFDEIHELDIVDANAGSHGKAFATNFNPEINIREVTQKGKYWLNGKWVETEPHERRRVLLLGDQDLEAFLSVLLDEPVGDRLVAAGAHDARERFVERLRDRWLHAERSSTTTGIRRSVRDWYTS